jgi:hypothetical protein
MFRLKEWTTEHIRILDEAENFFQLIEACEEIKIYELKFYPSGILCTIYLSVETRGEIPLGKCLIDLVCELIDICAKCLFNCHMGQRQFGSCYYFDQKRRELWEKLWKLWSVK